MHLTCQVKENPALLLPCLKNKQTILPWILRNKIKWEVTCTWVIPGDENILCLPSFYRPCSQPTHHTSHRKQLPLHLTPDPHKTIRSKNIIPFVCIRSTGPQAKSWHEVTFAADFSQGTQNKHYSVSTKPEKRSSRRLERVTWECIRSFLL